ncbi:MAG: DNA-directed RNA polymerase subunit K [Candidatus Aenigmarchaeota archaeon]|nr:DNA-directed RNA polymerase subunit K [Candidatus Aenigmarchaeota archaeon]
MFEYPGFTRFETTRIISARTLQLSMGAPPLIRTESLMPQDIARKEFDMNILPITVKRMMPKRAE